MRASSKTHSEATSAVDFFWLFELHIAQTHTSSAACSARNTVKEERGAVCHKLREFEPTIVMSWESTEFCPEGLKKGEDVGHARVLKITGYVPPAQRSCGTVVAAAAVAAAPCRMHGVPKCEASMSFEIAEHGETPRSESVVETTRTEEASASPTGGWRLAIVARLAALERRRHTSPQGLRRTGPDFVSLCQHLYVKNGSNLPQNERIPGLKSNACHATTPVSTHYVGSRPSAVR